MSIGRTDLPGGDYDALINNIENKLLSLPPETIVLTGHGPKLQSGSKAGTIHTLPDKNIHPLKKSDIPQQTPPTTQKVSEQFTKTAARP